MSFFLLGKGPEGDLRLLSATTVGSRKEALAALSRITADPSFTGWDDEIYVLDLEHGIPVLLVRAAAETPSADVLSSPVEQPEAVEAVEADIIEELLVGAVIEELPLLDEPSTDDEHVEVLEPVGAPAAEPVGEAVTLDTAESMAAVEEDADEILEPIVVEAPEPVITLPVEEQVMTDGPGDRDSAPTPEEPADTAAMEASASQLGDYVEIEVISNSDAGPDLEAYEAGVEGVPEVIELEPTWTGDVAATGFVQGASLSDALVAAVADMGPADAVSRLDQGAVEPAVVTPARMDSIEDAPAEASVEAAGSPVTAEPSDPVFAYEPESVDDVSDDELPVIVELAAVESFVEPPVEPAETESAPDIEDERAGEVIPLLAAPVAEPASATDAAPEPAAAEPAVAASAIAEPAWPWAPANEDAHDAQPAAPDGDDVSLIRLPSTDEDLDFPRPVILGDYDEVHAPPAAEPMLEPDAASEPAMPDSESASCVAAEPVAPADTAAAAAADSASASDSEPSGYQPSADAVAGLTCDDCVYMDTCPNKDERQPASCGSFMWR